MSNEPKLREAFEARMTDNGKWPRAVEQGRNGCYLLAQTENAWAEWQACAEALATTEPTSKQPLQVEPAVNQQLTTEPVDEREAFEREMSCEEIWGHRSFKKKPDGRYANWCVDLMWDVWQARAARAKGVKG